MNFGDAIAALKAGQSVSRSGWNGKNMYIYLATLVEGVQPCICMFTVDGKFQPGWLASQPDMLAEDWGVVSAPAA